jgi:hypothetical protein
MIGGPQIDQKPRDITSVNWVIKTILKYHMAHDLMVGMI